MAETKSRRPFLRHGDGRHPVLRLHDHNSSQRLVDLGSAYLIVGCLTICVMWSGVEREDRLRGEMQDLRSDMLQRDVDDINWSARHAERVAGEMARTQVEAVHQRVDVASIQLHDLLEALRQVAAYPGCRTYLPPPRSPFSPAERVCTVQEDWRQRLGVDSSWAARWEEPIRPYGSCEDR